MNPEIPIVDFGLLNEKCYITQFIQVDNPELRSIAESIKANTAEEIILQVLRFVAKSIEYPLYIGYVDGLRLKAGLTKA